MLKLNANIKEIEFNSFLDICFKYSSYFTFTQNGYTKYAKSQEHILFLEELTPFLIKRIKTHHWHCYYVPKGYLIHVFLYKVDMEAKEIIKKHFNNLFLKEQMNNKLGEVSKLPEDLCFFIEDKLFVGTVSHEEICHVYPPGDQIYNEIHQLGDWTILDHLIEEQINLSSL